MMPSPKGEVVSFNFWYPPPTWFHGDLAKGQITWDRPLFGVRRVLYQRCVEDIRGWLLLYARNTSSLRTKCIKVH
ncbi:unnamed protein product [Durusdinium trenchii]|uniref:Uncharacterized protein n=1 Tax=Durusdinium trenchii TaxID=1381693 RepID=A0ABP0JCV7_9DINO